MSFSDYKTTINGETVSLAASAGKYPWDLCHAIAQVISEHLRQCWFFFSGEALGLSSWGIVWLYSSWAVTDLQSLSTSLVLGILEAYGLASSSRIAFLRISATVQKSPTRLPRNQGWLWLGHGKTTQLKTEDNERLLLRNEKQNCR